MFTKRMETTARGSARTRGAGAAAAVIAVAIAVVLCAPGGASAKDDAPGPGTGTGACWGCTESLLTHDTRCAPLSSTRNIIGRAGCDTDVILGADLGYHAVCRRHGDYCFAGGGTAPQNPGYM